MTAPRWAAPAATAAALVALVAWAFWRRWTMLDASPYPFGVDGYYYPIQLRSLLEHGALQYPAAPLVFWWLAPFAALSDPIVGAKLGAALGGALIALPAYGIGARLGKHRVAGLFAAVVAAFSAGAEYMSTEFVKNSVALTVALVAVWLALRALERPTRGRIAAVVLALVAAALAHKLAIAIALGAAVPALVAEIQARRDRRVLAILAAATALLLAAGVVAACDQLGALLSTTAEWDAPTLASPHLVFDHEALIGGCVGLVVAALLVPRIRRALGVTLDLSSSERAVAIVAAAASIAIALPWLAVDDSQGPGFRLRIIASVPLAMCAAVGVGALIPKLGRDGSQIAAAAAAALVIIAPRDRTEGMIGTAPALVTGCTALAGHIPDGATVVVAERHVEYMAAWYAHATVTLRPESVPAEHRVRLLLPMSPVTGGAPLTDALDAARVTAGIDPPIDLHPDTRNGLVLVTESTWRWLLAHMSPRAREHFAAWQTI